MKHPLDLVDAQEAGVVGFATVDDKGRVSLTKPVRQALLFDTLARVMSEPDDGRRTTDGAALAQPRSAAARWSGAATADGRRTTADE